MGTASLFNAHNTLLTQGLSNEDLGSDTMRTFPFVLRKAALYSLLPRAVTAQSEGHVVANYINSLTATVTLIVLA